MTDIETIPPDPDEFMGPRRFRITCLCHRCNRQYSYVSTSVSAPDKPCPRKKCKEASIEEEIEKRARNLAAMLESQRAPATVGASVVVKAVDTTAQIVMEDHKLTDLKDNIRAGDSVAPKLPPHLQKMADGYWGGGAVVDRIGNKRIRDRVAAQLNRMGQRALHTMAPIPGQLPHQQMIPQGSKPHADRAGEGEVKVLFPK